MGGEDAGHGRTARSKSVRSGTPDRARRRPRSHDPPMLLARIVEDIVRTDGRAVLAGLIRLTGGDFDAAEDALQEAYTRALVSLAPRRRA